MEIIISILSTLVATGIPATLLFFRANKRKAEAEAKTAEAQVELAKAQGEQQRNANALAVANEYRDLAEKREAQLESKENLVNKLYAEIGEWRRKNTELEVWKAQNEYKLCQVKGCDDRTPPTGY